MDRAIGMMYDACEMELDVDQCKEAMFIYEKAFSEFREVRHQPETHYFVYSSQHSNTNTSFFSCYS